MKTIPRRFRQTRFAVFLIASIALVAATHAADYVDLRRIEPIHGDATAGAAKAAVCAACHGPNGNAIVPAFPKLAGQRADYLYHRLAAFKHADPKDPYFAQSPMPAQTANLSDEDLRNLAAYFAAQTPAAPPAAAPAVAQGNGEALYRDGDPARGAPPCQGCHGDNAQGGPIDAGSQYLAYPSLHGQHAPYLAARLNNFRNGLPHGSSNDFIMHDVARTLDDDSIQALTGWLASLPVTDAR